MLTIGVTGSYGTGKSTVTGMFVRLGAKRLDADRIVSGLISPSGRCYNSIIRAFGKEILKGRVIDRRKLARVIFTSTAKRKKLESIIHPKVRAEFRKRIAHYRKGKRVRAVVCDIPLLFESRDYGWLDVTVVVKSSRELQIKRVMKKTSLTRSETLARIGAQMPITKKIQKADYVIDNRGDRRNTEKQVREIWNELFHE